MKQPKLPIIFLTFANDKVDDALYLRNLPKELHEIRTALDKAQKAGLCEIIERTAATVNDIFDTFQDPRYKDRIAIFHYGGHASGNQLMLETLDGGHGTSHSDGLIPFLGKQKGLQLAFFNGCSSQEQALELSEAGVPTVIGTATAIKDEMATELAGRFYNGIASGSTIHQAWLEAIDILKTKTDTKKRKGLRLRHDKSNDFPWNMYIRDGAEMVKHWNLPDAARNPLFGLPDLPKLDLPEEPFRFLRRYEPQHAEIFFGRGRYIRQLYDRITSDKAAPIILFYGQSGAGKSSTLDSGLLPRLQREADVKYLRRDAKIGLLATLDQALGGQFKSAVVHHQEGKAVLVSDLQRQLGEIEKLKPVFEQEEQTTYYKFVEQLQNKLHQQEINVDTSQQTTRLARWLAIEEETGRPFHILLDQVEETFTRFNPAIENELDQLLIEIQQIFSDVNERPKGKIILSYRKEYHPEILENCKKLQLPREEIFLKKLEKEDIEQVVEGISSTEHLRQRYHIAIEPELPAVIADDLLEDKDSPIAPVLSILLTKMWHLASSEQTSIFSVAQYQTLKKEGILMEDFFHQQMEQLQSWKPDLEETGLALDVLNFHTTALGTAGSQSVEKLRERYQHQSEAIDKLLDKFKQLYLLTDAGTGETGLAHDTLAPIVIKEIRSSDKMGQRALRILESKTNEYQEDKRNLLDSRDLKLVEEGREGMRLWSELEQDLVKASQKKRTKQRALRRNLIALGVAAILAIIGLSYWSYQQMQDAKINNFETQSIIAFNNKNYVASMDWAERLLDIRSDHHGAYNIWLKSKYFYRYQYDGQYYQTPTFAASFRGMTAVKFGKNETIVAGLVSDKSNNEKLQIRTMEDKVINDIDLNNHQMTNFTISPDDKYIALETLNLQDTTLDVALWDVKGEKPIFKTTHPVSQYDFQPGYAKSYEKPSSGFSPLGKYFLYQKKDKIVLVALEDETHDTISIEGHLATLSSDFSMNVFSPNEEMVIYNTYTGTIIFDLKTQKIVKKLETEPPYGDGENKSYFIKNGTQAIFDKGNESNVLFEISDNTQQIYEDLSASIRADICFSESGKYVVIEDFATREPDKYILDATTRERLLDLKQKELTFEKTDSTILVAQNNRLLATLDAELAPVLYQSFSENEGRTSVGIINQRYYIDYQEDEIYIWDIRPARMQLITTIFGRFIDLSQNGRYLSTTNGVYDLKSNPSFVGVTDVLERPISKPEEITHFFSEDGKYLIHDKSSFENGDAFEVFDAITGARKSVEVLGNIKNIKAYKEQFYRRGNDKVASYQNGKIQLAANDFDLLLKNGNLLVTKNKQLVMELKGRKGDIVFFAFKADGRAIEIISEHATNMENANWAGVGGNFQYFTELIWLKGVN